MKIALVRNGFFLTAENGGGSTTSERRAVADGAAEWEIFTLDGPALKCHDASHYLTFDKDQSIRASATQIGPWENIATLPVVAGPVSWHADDHGGSFIGDVQIVQADQSDLMANESGPLIDSGRWYFVNEQGQPHPILAYTVYSFLIALRAGDTGRANAMLDEAIRYGFNAVLILGSSMGDWYEANGLLVDVRDPQWQSWMIQARDLVTARKLRFMVRTLQGAQWPDFDGRETDRHLTPQQCQDAWSFTKQLVNGNPLCMAAPFNEGNVNLPGAVDPLSFDLTGVSQALISAGTTGIGNPPYQMRPGLTLPEWEPRREPRYKALDDAGAGILELLAGYRDPDGTKHGPFSLMFLGEGPYFYKTSPDFYGDQRWTSVSDARALGANAGANVCGIGTGTSRSLVALPVEADDTISPACMAATVEAFNAAFQAVTKT